MKNLKIFTNNIEEKAKKQIDTLLNQEPFANSKVRIMPDVHAGAGCVIGFTADLGDKVIPNVVGVDIGCGMITLKLGKINIDLEKLDNVIREFIPNGFETHEKEQKLPFDLEELFVYNELKNLSRIKSSMGTLGGGNHFIEIDKDNDENLYLIIHSGSRNLGKQVADIYQNMAINNLHKVSKEEVKNKVEELKKQGRHKEIQIELKKMKPTSKIPKELCYLIGEEREKYLHDMKLCQQYAYYNRLKMATIISEKMGFQYGNFFQTVHNYIGEDNIVRKGAISAYKDEIVLIPINMRDGCIIAKGLGNEDYNYSAPHGAGRIMSRRKAKDTINLKEFKETMVKVYSTSVNENTLDEAPMVYKPINEILNNISETVEVLKIIKPIYNFKSN